MATTTKWALRYPASSAAPNVPLDIQNLATDVDDRLPQFGTLAARSGVTQHAGLIYYATDTVQAFISDGTAWHEYPLDTVGTADIANLAVTAAKIEAQQAWQSVACAQASQTGLTTGTSNLFYYKDSLGFVHIRPDAFRNDSGTGKGAVTFWTLPSGYRPGQNTSGGHTGAFGFQVTTTGLVQTSNLAVDISTVYVPAAAIAGGGHFRAEN